MANCECHNQMVNDGSEVPLSAAVQTGARCVQCLRNEVQPTGGPVEPWDGMLKLLELSRKWGMLW